MKPKYFLPVSIGLLFLAWLVQGISDSLFFHQELNILESVLTNIPTHELMRRLAIMLTIITCFLPFYYILKKNNKINSSIHELKEQLIITLNSIGDAVIATDINGKITGMNPIAEELTGWKESDAVSRHVNDVFVIINEETRAKAENPIEKVLKNGLTIGLANHTALISKEGLEYSIADSAAPIINRDGNMVGVVMVFRDVTDERKNRQYIESLNEELESKVKLRTAQFEKINEEISRQFIEKEKAQEALKKSEEKYRNLVEQLPIGIYRTKSDGTIIQSNPEMAVILGFENQDILIGNKIGDYYLNPESLPINSKNSINPNNILTREIQLTKIDGSNIWAREICKVYYDANGFIDFIDGTISDITRHKLAEQAVAESEHRYRQLFINQNDLYFRIGAGGELINLSPSIHKILDYTSEELTGKNINEFVTDMKIAAAFFNRLKKFGRINDFILPIKRRNGGIVYLSANVHLYTDSSRKVIGVEGIARDITNDIKLKDFMTIQYGISKAITSTESISELCEVIYHLLKKIIGQNTFFFATLNPETNKITFPFVSGKENHQIEIDLHDPISLNAKVIREGKSLFLFKEQLKEYSENNSFNQEKIQFYYAEPLIINNKVIGAIGIKSDNDEVELSQNDLDLFKSISDQVALAIDRKRMLLESSFQLQFMQNLIDTIPNPVYYKDSRNKLYAGGNKEFETFLGIPISELIGKSVFDLFPDELARRYDDLDNELLANQGIQKLETIEKRADGSLRNIIYYKSCYKDNSGEIAGIVGVAVDITDMKYAEQELLQAREYAELLYNLSPAGVFTINKNKEITSWNDRAAHITKMSSGEVINKECPLCEEYIDNPNCLLFDENVPKPIFGREKKFINKQGEERTILMNIDLLYDAEGNIIGGIESMDDITKKKKMETELALRSETNAIIADISNAILGHSSIEHLCKLILEQCLLFTSSNYGFVGYRDTTQKELTIPVITREKKIISTDGLNFDSESVYFARWILENKQKLVINNFKDYKECELPDKHFEINKLLAVPSMFGDNLSGIIALANPENDYNEFDIELLERLASLLAIGMQKLRAEKEILAALEKEHELNELKSKFISMVSHEYRTPLTAVVLSTELLCDYGDRLSEENKAKHFSRIKQSVQTMSHLLDDIIAYNKLGSGKVSFSPQFIDIEQMCLSLSHEVKYTTKDKCVIDLTISNGNIIGYVDERLLKQILVNLLTNAVKFSPEKSTVVFTVDIQHEKAEFIISDNGIGIPIDEQDKIFEPFFRGSNSKFHSGTGLGLSIVKNSLDQHKGTITFVSDDNGTTFTVIIPFFKIYEKELLNKN